MQDYPRKTAVCISGSTRILKYTINSIIEHLVKPFNADIFIHTWRLREDRRPAYDFDFSSLDAQVVIEDYDSPWNFLHQWQHKNILPMFYSIWRANQMAKGYDVVIRSRTDYLYEKGPDLNRLKKGEIQVQYNGVPRGQFAARGQFKSEIDGKLFVPDNFACGFADDMEKYSSVYPNLISLFNTCPEVVLGNCFNHYGLTPAWSDARFYALIEEQDKKLMLEHHYEETKRIYINV